MNEASYWPLLNFGQEDHHEGHLIKKGKIRRNWKKRWFVLDKGELRYYRSKNEKKSCLGKIEISGKTCGPIVYSTKTDKKLENSFQILTSTRTYFLIAETAQEYFIWKDKIIKCGGIWDNSLVKVNVVKEDGSVEEQEESILGKVKEQVRKNSTEEQKKNTNLSNIMTTNSKDYTNQLYSSSEKDSLYHVFKLFRELVEARDIIQVESLLSASTKADLHNEIKSIQSENSTFMDERQFWEFLEFPPLEYILFVSESKNFGNGILILQYDESNLFPHSKKSKGEVTFVKDDANGDWLIKKEDWDIIGEDS